MGRSDTASACLHSVCAEPGRAASSAWTGRRASAALARAQARGAREWALPENFQLRFESEAAELFVGGVYVRLFLRDPRFPLRSPKARGPTRVCTRPSVLRCAQPVPCARAPRLDGPSPNRRAQLPCCPALHSAGPPSARCLCHGRLCRAARRHKAPARSGQSAGCRPERRRAARAQAFLEGLLAGYTAAAAGGRDVRTALVLAAAAAALLGEHPGLAEHGAALGYTDALLRVLAAHAPPADGARRASPSSQWNGGRRADTVAAHARSVWCSARRRRRPSSLSPGRLGGCGSRACLVPCRRAAWAGGTAQVWRGAVGWRRGRRRPPACAAEGRVV